MTARYVRHPNVRLTALAGEGVALDLDSRRYFTLNESGLVLVEELARPRTLDELAGALVARFDVTAAEASATARAFVERCVAAGLVAPADAG